MDNNDKTMPLFTRANTNSQNTAPAVTRCMGCMNEFGKEFELCPHCGYVVGTPPRLKCYLQPGIMLAGRYLLGRVIGQGGFGITYIGYDQKEKRKVAIKEFFPNALSTREAGSTDIICVSKKAETYFVSGVKKMLDEGERLSRFSKNPNIVDVYDIFEENNTAYIVMEYLEGKNLKEYAAEKGGKISPDEAVQLILPILDALEEMHAENMIHRDIAPDNIYICNNGSLKLLDFGSARIAVEDAEKSLSVLVKPGYAPKEQYASRSKQGPWTDVYSVCATLYKMITGEAPVESIERENTPLKTFESFGITGYDALEYVLFKGLEPEPQNRIRFARVLKSLLQNPAAAVPAAKPVAAIEKPEIQKAQAPVQPVMAGNVNSAPAAAPVTPAAPPQPQKKKKKKWPIVLGILIPLLLVLIIGLVGLACFFIFGGNQVSDYPNEFQIVMGENDYSHNSTGNVSFYMDVTEDGNYTFESLNGEKWGEDLKATLEVNYEEVAGNDDSEEAGNSDFSITYYLKSGDRVWLYVDSYDDYIKTVSLNVTYEAVEETDDSEHIYTLVTGENTFSHNSTGEAVLTFTAQKGTYEVESLNGVNGTDDLRASLYINASYVTENDEGGENNGDFKLSFDCESGDSVKIVVNTYNASDLLGELYVKCTYIEPQDSIEERIYNFYYENGIYVRATDAVYSETSYSSEDRYWDTSDFRYISGYTMSGSTMWLQIDTTTMTVWYPLEITSDYESWFTRFENDLSSGVYFNTSETLYSGEPSYESSTLNWSESGYKTPFYFVMFDGSPWYCFEANDNGSIINLWCPVY